MWGVLSLLGLSVALSGCGSGGSTPQGRVRVINALTNVPNNANVDVNVNNGQATSSNIGFGTANSSAVTVDAGNVPVSILSTGTTTTLAGPTTINVAQGADNLVLVTGTSGTTGATAPQVVRLGQVDLGNPPVSNQARIYFVNAAPGSADATFNLTVTNPNGLPATSTATATALAYPAMSAPQFVTVVDAASTVSLTVTSGTETIPLNTTAIAGGNTYAVVLFGRQTSTSTGLTTQIVRLNP